MIYVSQHCLVGIKSFAIAQEKIFEILVVNIFRVDQYVYTVAVKIVRPPNENFFLLRWLR